MDSLPPITFTCDSGYAGYIAYGDMYACDANLDVRSKDNGDGTVTFRTSSTEGLLLMARKMESRADSPAMEGRKHKYARKVLRGLVVRVHAHANMLEDQRQAAFAAAEEAS